MNQKAEHPFGSVESILAWFAEAKKQPTGRGMQVQLGVHFEEVSEMLETLTSESPSMRHYISRASTALEELADAMKAEGSCPVEVIAGHDEDLLDALCDQIVTAVGSAFEVQSDIVQGLAEVDRSNWSKFVKGQAIFYDNGKIAKGPDYFKADLSKFV